jgi:hypothetical protein
MAEYTGNGGSEMQLAATLNLKTPITIRKAFREDKQLVSDTILTRLMKLIDFEGAIVYVNGLRLYYVKNGKQ